MSDKPRILVVDDEPSCCVLIQDFLSRQGYDIHIADTGQKAMACLAENCFDLVLLDLVIPDMNGFQIMERIHGNCPDTLVIIMTGYATIESAVEGLKKGAYHYLKKPLRPEELVRTIENALEYGRIRAERNQAEQELRKYRDHLEELVERRTAQWRLLYERLQQEVEERRKTDKALNESEQKLALALMGAEIGLWEWNLQTGEVAFSQRLAEILGYDLEEMEPNASFCKNHVHPDDAGKVWEALNAHLDGKILFFEAEYRMRAKSGEWKWILDRGKLLERDEQGMPLRAMGTHWDITERMRIEEALQASKEKYRVFLENFQGIAYQSNLLTLEPSFFHGTVEQITGYTAEDLVSGRISWKKVVHPDDVEKLRREAKKLTTIPGYVADIEYRLVRKDGEIRWVQNICRCVPDGQGKPEFIQGAMYDITDRIRAEEAVRESERRFRELFERTLDGIISCDMNLRFLECNAAYEKMLGYSAEELRHVKYEDVTPEKWRAKEREIAKNKTLKEGYSGLYEKEYRRKDGTIFPVELSAYLIRDKNGRPQGMWAFVRDITKRKRAEEALRESEEKYRLVVDNANDGIFIAQDGVLKFPNPLTLRVTGYSEEELAATPFVNIIHPEDRSRVFQRYLRALSGEEPVKNFSYRVIGKGGQELWVETNAVVTTWEGRPALLNLVRDITVLKRLEAQLLQAQKLEAVGTLAGGIAHDFNNLLQAVQGYTELLLLDKSAQVPGHRELHEILKAAHKGSSLVKQLLAFSRRTTSNPRPVNLNHDILEARQLLEHTIPRMISITFRLAEDLRFVQVDPVQIEQIILNLAVNARDAMPEGGTLTIETENVTLGQGLFGDEATDTFGPYVLLSVSDTGCGMDKQTLPRIFDPFYTTKEVGKGTGLGLAMVYGIVKDHGGYITCQSETGMGTTFRIYFPAIETKEEPCESTSDEPVGKGSGTILLVDDEEMILDYGKKMLELFGYTVLTAVDGETGLDLYREKRQEIDLVILDMIMPGMGGRRCLKEMLKVDPSVRVLVASGYSLDNSSEDLVKAGASGFIPKPYQMNEMVKAVHKALSKSNQYA